MYGASVGILMLEARFPRIPGDMGNAVTWPFPVHYRVVSGATPDLVVRHGAEGLLERFIEEGRALVRMGVSGITTNCGFLTLFQEPLKQALNVPVAASSLMQVPQVQSLLPADRKVGILTISPATLTAAHLDAAGVGADVAIGGTPDGCEFVDAILGNRAALDVDQARADILQATSDLVAAAPEVGALVLECTNMCPYANDIAREFGIPVFSIYDFICWFQAGLVPRKFPVDA